MRLGSFKLQDNSSTQFKARELKSVFVESECRYLKLVLYKPHPNTKNLFSQVSMLSLSVFGDFLDYENEYISSLKTLDPLRGLSEQFKSRDRGIYTPQGTDPGVGMYFSRPNFTSRQSRILKDIFNDKIKALDNEKRRAIQINDADKAQKLKKDIDKTMKFAKLAKELEYKKLLAIENEDYETANLIKLELDKVKKTIMGMGDIPKPRGSSMSSRSIRTPASDGPMTAEDRMNPSRQIIHSIKQIESDLSRVYINLEKPDPSKYISQQYQINRTYEQSIRGTTGNIIYCKILCTVSF